MMIVQLGKFSKNRQVVHLKQVHFINPKMYLNNIAKKKNS